MGGGGEVGFPTQKQRGMAHLKDRRTRLKKKNAIGEKKGRGKERCEEPSQFLLKSGPEKYQDGQGNRVQGEKRTGHKFGEKKQAIPRKKKNKENWGTKEKFLETASGKGWGKSCWLNGRKKEKENPKIDVTTMGGKSETLSKDGKKFCNLCFRGQR